jgi:hypothetical protein
VLIPSTALTTATLVLAIIPSAQAAAPESCGMSQASLDTTAQAVWNQVLADQVPECALNGSGPPIKGAGVCASPPVSFLPGDVLPGDGSSITDTAGNTWSLSAPAQSGNGHWYGAIVFDGQQVNDGYFAALRLVNGKVYALQAKGAGWTIADPRNPGDTGNVWTYVADPGPSGVCGGRSGNSAPQFAQAATTGAQAADPAATASPTGQYSVAPFASQSCPTQTFSWQASIPDAITPGSGSFSADGGTYSIDASNGDAASVNGAPINDGAYWTSHLARGSDGKIYGQDQNSGQWFELISGGNSSWWQPLVSEPAAIIPTATNSSTPASPSAGPLNTESTFSQKYGYFEATVAADGSFSLVGSDGTTIQVGQSTDGTSHVYGIAITPQTTTLYADGSQVSQVKTQPQTALYLVGTNIQSARAFPNIQDAIACVPSVAGEQSSVVSPVASLAPALSLAGSMTTTPAAITPANTIGATQ